jgi:hypothetical protein
MITRVSAVIRPEGLGDLRSPSLPIICLMLMIGLAEKDRTEYSFGLGQAEVSHQTTNIRIGTCAVYVLHEIAGRWSITHGGYVPVR